MEWKVTNALNRDVERQQLNKILAEIHTSVNKSDTSDDLPGGNVKDVVAEMVENNVEEGISVEYNTATQVLDFVVSSFVIRLAGDVTGSAEVNALRSVTINTEIDPSKIGVTEAPIDGNPYWRMSGDWQQVPSTLVAFATLQGEGFPSRSYDEESGITTWNSRVLEGTTDQIVVTDGDGVLASPVISLADLTDTGIGTSPIQLITRDSKGRVEGTEDASTDDLPEGVANLYFTEERAQDAVGEILASTGDIELAYDDAVPSITATITNLNLTSLASLVPADGDIIEYNGTASEWAVTKNPRELYLDGGNF